MWQLNAENRWSFSFDKVGRWWNNNTEIDIVAIDRTGNDIIFGECKYWENKVGIDILRTLEEKAKSVEWNQKTRRQWYVLFSINGFTNDSKYLAETRKDILLWQ